MTEIEQTSLDQVANEEEVAVSIACRLLWQGWDATWDWFKREYRKVDRFDPQVTHEKLRAIVECYREDYSDVRIPDPPSTEEE